MTAPTAAQITALNKFGLSAAGTEASCKSLLRWIHNGGTQTPERITIIRAAQARYAGQRVRKSARGNGTCTHLVWPGLGARASQADIGHRFKHPLNAYVRWDEGVASTSSVSSLDVIEEPPLFIATGASGLREGLPLREGPSIAAVVRDPHCRRYLILHWDADAAWHTFVSGEIESGRNAEHVARTEVHEETGYKNLLLIGELPRFDSKFYHAAKRVNRFAHVSPFLFHLINAQQDEILAEEEARHRYEWVDEVAMDDLPLPEGHRYLMDYIKQNHI